MRILAFDTATAATSVALLDSDTGLELEARDDPPAGGRPAHTTKLLALIVQTLTRAGTDWDAVDRIAVGVGPGTFTGLRIGVATARALALARDIPLVGISSLQSLALNCRRAPPNTAAVAAIIDARRGELFVAAWRLADQAETEPRALAAQLLERAALTPEALAGRLSELGPDPLAIGTGAIEFRSALERAGANVPADDSDLHRVTALNHCRLALEAGAVDGTAKIQPQYLRLPDAELARRRAAQAGR